MKLNFIIRMWVEVEVKRRPIRDHSFAGERDAFNSSSPSSQPDDIYGLPASASSVRWHHNQLRAIIDDATSALRRRWRRRHNRVVKWPALRIKARSAPPGHNTPPSVTVRTVNDLRRAGGRALTTPDRPGMVYAGFLSPAAHPRRWLRALPPARQPAGPLGKQVLHKAARSSLVRTDDNIEWCLIHIWFTPPRQQMYVPAPLIAARKQVLTRQPCAWYASVCCIYASLPASVKILFIFNKSLESYQLTSRVLAA